MSDQNPQDSRAVQTDAGQQNGQGSKVDEAWRLATGAGTGAANQSNQSDQADQADQAEQAVQADQVDQASQSNQPRAVEAPALTENRVFAYGAIAATIGIVVGLGFAAVAGHGAPRTVSAASASSNSNATALATLVKPETATSADANTPPVELPAAQTAPDLQAKPASHKKTKKKDLDMPARFAIEGDDELVGYDTSKGVIQTSARKTFLVTVTSVGGNSSAWQEWPANIHYKCDLNSSCTLTRRGGAVLYAQLKK
jgi:hypothetical protein